MSSKGQIVIPKEIRKNFKKNELLVFLEQNGQIILKKSEEIYEKFEEDFENAQKYTKLVQDYEKGNLKINKMQDKDFLEEIEKW